MTNNPLHPFMYYPSEMDRIMTESMKLSGVLFEQAKKCETIDGAGLLLSL